MKKLIIVFISLTVIFPLYAQDNTTNLQNIYYKNVLIQKIYPSGRGYVVQYLKINGEVGTIGVPNNWFMDPKTGGDPAARTAAVSLQYTAAGKAEIVALSPGKAWPSMSVFYVDGKFHHVKLYVHWFKGHQTWGNIPQGMDVSRYFSDDDETFNIKY